MINRDKRIANAGGIDSILSQLDQLHDLLDLIDNDWNIHDLDQRHESEFGTLGQTLLGLMQRYEKMQATLRKIADGAGNAMHLAKKVLNHSG